MQRAHVTIALALVLSVSLTAGAPPLTAIERQRLVSHLAMTEAWLIDEVSSLSPAQLDFRPSSTSWTVRDVVDHLVVVGTIYWDDLQTALKAPGTGRRNFSTDADILWYGIDRTNRETAIPPELPKGRARDIASALKTFRGDHARLTNFIRTTDQDLRGHIVERQQSDAYQWALLISTHEQRHILQIREIKAHPNFPRAIQAASRVTVTLPHVDSELSVEGKAIPGEGRTRIFETPPLEAGTTYRYTFAATWRPNGYTTITRSKTVSFRAGEQVAVDLSIGGDERVRVQYVPTPDEIADGMVKLAGVTSQDVVYEPGCGDARVTIAAVAAGARKGVGIDIDPDRVADSRAAVKAAGLEDRIEIRLGDALDIKDLSSATVVFLYMGDHFNMLIRPLLWKELPVGARVVSHRFTMGDWKPDKTVAVPGYEISEYELHLWTITEDVKRRLQ